MTATLIGYARCSTDEQVLTARRDTLGVPDDRVYLDHGMTGTNRELNARATSDGIRIYPRLPYPDKDFPAYEQPGGTPIDIRKLTTWLAGHHTQAQIDRNALRAADTTFQPQQPGPDRGMER